MLKARESISKLWERFAFYIALVFLPLSFAAVIIGSVAWAINMIGELING